MHQLITLSLRRSFIVRLPKVTLQLQTFRMASTKTSFNSNNIPGMNHTSGATDAVWVATEPYSKFPKFPQLDKNIDTDVVIVGAGITGISTALECVKKGLKTVLLEAREVVSGETGRTSGHLSNSLDERYYELIKIYGVDKTKLIFESHQYALEHIGQVSKELGIECEYRQLNAQYMVNVPKDDAEYSKENDLRQEFEAIAEIGFPEAVEYQENTTLGASYKGAVLTIKKQATFHPTKYVNGILNYLQKEHSDLFSCYTQTRMRDYKKHGESGVQVRTEGDLPPNPKPFSSEHGHHVNAKHMVMATNAPMHAIELIPKCSFWRTYVVALEYEKSALPDMMVYDNDDPYVYVRCTQHPDPSKMYLIVGGEDHKVGFENAEGQYQEHIDNLIKWTKANFPQVGSYPDFAWSGEVINSNDHIAYIGRDSTTGNKNLYVATADNGNGLTHGVVASRLLTDLITGVQNPWEEVYSPARMPKPRTLMEAAKDNVEQIAKYSRFVKTDVSDIEDIPKCQGAVMHAGIKSLGKPIAVYKGEDGNVIKFSAICPHAHGVVAWNPMEKSWDCPVHGSRFDGMTGKCVFGPSNRGLSAQDDAAKAIIEQETSG